MPATTSVASLAMVNLDCDDPRALAAFYSQVLGWEVAHSEDAYAMIGDGHVSIGFGHIDGYTPPAWSDQESGKRYHLDFHVDDVEKAVAACERLGATKPEFQPGGEGWTVLTDPAGHPFCLCPRPPAG